jgi:aldehyde dehydrogenase (NAD+)
MKPWFDTSQVFIAGRWQAPSLTGDTLPLNDPSTGSEIGRIARGGPEDIDAAVTAARKALHGAWGALTAADRGRLLARLGTLVTEHAEALAEMEATDVGKPLTQARADVTALARYCEFYAGAADKVMGQTIPFQQGFTVYTLREPIGVTGHIVPWNYPMQIIGRSLGAALAMGNACVLKPAEEACLTALAFADLARQAGFPDGAINVVPGLGAEAGAALTCHPGIGHISFTGSVATGRLVQAAAAQNVVPVTLELGGKSPQLVFADADLDKALPFLVNAGLQNAGQTCSASSRILSSAVTSRRWPIAWPGPTAARLRRPRWTDRDLGPLISARQKEIVTGYLDLAGQGQRIAEGQIAPDAPETGHYVAPCASCRCRPRGPPRAGGDLSAPCRS